MTPLNIQTLIFQPEFSIQILILRWRTCGYLKVNEILVQPVTQDKPAQCVLARSVSQSERDVSIDRFQTGQRRVKRATPSCL